MLRTILIRSAIIGSVLVALCFLLLYVGAYIMKSHDYAIEAYFNALQSPFKIHRIPYQNDSLRFVETGTFKDTDPILFFIHGAPGGWDAFKEYLADEDLRNSFRMISLDRPGYGDSDFGHSETDILKQAIAAETILNLYASQQVVLIGHSYGAPIAAQLSIRMNQRVSALMMIAPLIDPDSEPMPFYSIIANLRFFRWLLPKVINVASDEKQSHAQSLREISNIWSSMNIPVMHIHGSKDKLAPCVENINFSKQHIHQEFLIVENPHDMNHLLIWNNGAFIKKQILYLTSLM